MQVCMQTKMVMAVRDVGSLDLCIQSFATITERWVEVPRDTCSNTEGIFQAVHAGQPVGQE